MKNDYKDDVLTLVNLSKNYQPFQNGAEFKTQEMRDWSVEFFKDNIQLKETIDSLAQKNESLDYEVEDLNYHLRNLKNKMTDILADLDCATTIDEVKELMGFMRRALL